MCSSPKGSRARRSQVRKVTLSSEEYAEYACMVRRSTIAYKLAQERKEERREQLTKDQVQLVH